jgi:hypothetical protein
MVRLLAGVNNPPAALMLDVELVVLLVADE